MGFYNVGLRVTVAMAAVPLRPYDLKLSDTACC